MRPFPPTGAKDGERVVLRFRLAFIGEVTPNPLPPWGELGSILLAAYPVVLGTPAPLGLVGVFLPTGAKDGGAAPAPAALFRVAFIGDDMLPSGDVGMLLLISVYSDFGDMGSVISFVVLFYV